MTKERQTTKKNCSSRWPCCFTTPRSLSSSSRHDAGVPPINVAVEEITPPINVGDRGVSLPSRIEPTPPINVCDGGVSLPPRIEPTPPINVASPSQSAVSAAEEAELDRCLEKVATLIVNKLREIKGLKLKDVPIEGQETKLSWDFLKINSDRLKDLKEILDEGMSCAESLQKYIPEHGGKEVTQAVTPILAGIGSYHWITFGLLLVGKTLERWEAVTENKEECLKLLEEMAGLALILKQIRDRKMQNQNMKALSNEAVERVFNGYLLCCRQMSSSRLCGMFVATYDKSSLSQLRSEIDKIYKKITSQMTICIYDAITCVNKAPARPRNVMYPKHAVGIDDQVNEIIKMLDYESDEKALAVVLHNFGGMGKTTLAEAVFSSLDIKNCKYSMVKLFKDTKDVPNIVELQKTIIGDLTEKKSKDVEIQTYQEGQAEIQKILQECNAFIYIDNVLQSENSNSEELEHLLPRELSSAKKTRLLITARDSSLVCRNLASSSCESKVHPVKGIADEHAKYLLREGCRNKLSQIEITELINMCRGVPLLVKLVANFIRRYRYGNHEKEAYKAVKNRHDLSFSPTGERTLSETFAIDTLEEECRECFFDICCFFVGRSWHDMKMTYGEHLLDTLLSKALISLDSFEGRYSEDEVFDEGAIHVHDVLIDIARRSSEETRLHSIDKFREIIGKSDNEREIRIKGLQCNDLHLSISAKDIDQLHDCLRVLDFRYAIVEGQCLSSFPHMKYLCTYQPHRFLLEKMPKLRFLQVNESSRILRCRPVQLQYLNGSSSGESIEYIYDLFPSLRSLRLWGCSHIKSLPANIGSLTSLEALRLCFFYSLEEFPASFSNLVSLRFLSLLGRSSLTSIPDNLFHNMPLLTYLQLSQNKIRKLPPNINCPSLVVLDLSGSEELEELPESICKLSEMRVLRLGSCSNLKKLPQEIGRLRYLVQLDLSFCGKLQELPQGFGNLHSLEILYLGFCECLKVLPRDFGCLTSLKELHMSDCRSLEDLCNDFVQLQSLTALSLERCPMLRGEWLDLITKLPSLKKVEISGSKHLIKRWSLCYREYNINNFDHKQAMCEDLFAEDYFDEYATDHRLVGKDGQLHAIECHIPMLIIIESSTDPNKLEYLKSVLSRIDKRVPVIHFGDRCVDWPQEIEDAIVARATPDSVAFLLWTHCSQQFLEFPNNVSLVYATLAKRYSTFPEKKYPTFPEKYGTFTLKTFGKEDIVRMSTKYLNMKHMYRCWNDEWAISLLKEMMGPRKREDGMHQVKLQISKNGREVIVEDLEAKNVYIVAFPSTILQDFSDMDKEKLCQEYQQLAQHESTEVICTKRGDASREFNQWIMNNIPDCILLESLDSLTVDAIQFLSDCERHSRNNFEWLHSGWLLKETDNEGIWILYLCNR